jgi:glutathione S-transferase
MITLCGFALSNYYNKVKIALLEKGMPFEEELNWATKDEATLAESPLGKVPFIRTPQGPLSESAVIMEYLEDLQPSPSLWPTDPFARAKVRELIVFLELHLELVARRVYSQAFFGGKVERVVARLKLPGQGEPRGHAGTERHRPLKLIKCHTLRTVQRLAELP